MTTRTRGDVRIAELRESLPVDGRQVLGDLVDADAGVVLAHEARVGVAPATNLQLFSADGLADEALGRVHSIESGVLITAVARDAAKAASSVHVVGKGVGRTAEARVIEL